MAHDDPNSSVLPMRGPGSSFARPAPSSEEGAEGSRDQGTKGRAALGPSVPRSLDPSSWLPLSDLLAAAALPGPTDAARHRRLLRECEGLRRAGDAHKLGGSWRIRPEAQLCGRPATTWLAPECEPLAGGQLPPGHEHWSERDRQRYLDTRDLVKAWSTFRSAHPGQSDEELAPQFADSPFPRSHVLTFPRPPVLTFPRPPVPTSPRSHVPTHLWCEQHGLSCKPSVLRRYQRRLRIDGNVDRRGMSPRGTIKNAAPTSPEAWDLFKTHWLDSRRFTVRLCWEWVTAAAKRHGWDWPSLRTIQRRVSDELPPVIADYHRYGKQYWERKHGPKIWRDYSQTRPNQLWVGDEHRFDFLCLYNGRPIRAWLTAWEDFRSRKFTGWSIDVQAHSDTILRSLCDGIRRHGAPRELTIDNGKDYRAHSVAGGKRKRRESDRPRVDEARMTSICGRLGIDPHFCIPFNPGAKHIESAFRTMCERFSKCFDSYVGGSPDERPEDLYPRLRRQQVNVPTIERVRELFGRWVEEAYHNRAHSGDGMHGRSPNEVFSSEDPIPKRTAPAELLDWLLLKQLRRRVTRRGINVSGVYYGQGHLRVLQLIGREVLVKLDPADAAEIRVCDLEGRYLFAVRHDVLDGTDADHIRQSRNRLKAARELVKKARSAHDTAARSIEDEALIVAQAEYQQQLQATGTDGSPPPPRNVELLPGASDLLDNLPSVPRSLDPSVPSVPDPLDAAPSIPWSLGPSVPPAPDPLDLLPDSDYGEELADE